MGLFLLAPLMGEYLLGNLKFRELYLLPVLGLLYGAGAVLIREVTRRRGRGYTTVLGLGLAYALVEEGLVTQLLFNQDYFSGQRELAVTVVPALGIDVWLTLIVVAMHVVWSITIPIILVEAWAAWSSNSSSLAGRKRGRRACSSRRVDRRRRLVGRTGCPPRLRRPHGLRHATRLQPCSEIQAPFPQAA